MPLNLDFEDLPSELPPSEGRHRAKITDMVYESEGLEFPRVVWSFEFLDGKEKDKSARMWSGLSPKAKWKIKDIFLSLGLISIDPDTGKATPIQLDWDPKTGKVFKPGLINKIVWVDVSHGTYNNRTTASIDMVYLTEGGAATTEGAETNGKKRLA
jgi:hypothetical protein